MSEKEFEIYLSLLSRLLRLTSSQKTAISDELRDHLEQRLIDLLQAGKTRDEAIRLAMEEFGDVNDLALDLTRVSATRFKKVLVGSTLVATAAAILMIGWLSLFAPAPHLAVPPAHAQGSPPAIPSATAAGTLETLLKDGALFPPVLALPVEAAELQDVPLSEVCQMLERQLRVPVLIHQSAFQNAGLERDAPVTLTLPQLSAEEFLNHLTRSLDLAWTVENGLIQITVPGTERTVLRQYGLEPLTRQGHTLESLTSMLRLSVEGWVGDNDGQGSLAVVGETIVVRQTFANQRRIARTLAAIEGRSPLTILHTCTNRDGLLAALNTPTTIEFQDVPLNDAVSHLSQQLKVPVVFDIKALLDESVLLETPVSLALNDRPLNTILDVLLRDLNLTYQVRDGVLRITTRSKSENDLLYAVYSVHDLAPSEERFDQIVEALTVTTGSMWQHIDGQGGPLGQSRMGGCLLIGQTEQVHHEIQNLLGGLRQTLRQQPGPPGPTVRRMVTRYYRMPRDVATDLKDSLLTWVSPQNWVPVDGDSPGITVMAAGPRAVVAIHQTPTVHREIRQLFQRLEIGAELIDPVGANPENLGGPANLPGGMMGGGMIGGGGGGFF